MLKMRGGLVVGLAAVLGISLSASDLSAVAFLLAVDAKTGKQQWKVSRPHGTQIPTVDFATGLTRFDKNGDGFVGQDLAGQPGRHHLDYPRQGRLGDGAGQHA